MAPATTTYKITPFEDFQHFQIRKTVPRELSINLLAIDLNADGLASTSPLPPPATADGSSA